ncbi:MAG: cobalamin biosynthesis protein CobD [Gemmatimonadaceae bacterium]|nr:cobalamin biosynthesis protein CobD [Gloeobacterales cyanobacterium ES-bin-141]
MPTALTLGCAYMLDRLLGDPPHWYHPVQAMGSVIRLAEKFALSRIKSSSGRRGAGIVLTLALVSGSALSGLLLIDLAARLHPWLGSLFEVVILAACFANRSLGDAARSVLIPLATGDLPQARIVLSSYVGRDTQNLPEPEILRATLETVAENTTDGVTAPIFYAVLGGAPLALAFKAVSTLDSMIGYRDEPYTHFGWFAAKADDLLNWLPARLTALTLAALSAKPAQVIRLVRRDAGRDPSPNSGVSIVAFAAALGVRLGGENYYRGILKPKPYLGDACFPLTPERLREGLALLEKTAFLWTALGAGLLLVF